MHHLLIAFQSNRLGDQEKNPSQFDHLSATEVSVILNDTKYPASDVTQQENEAFIVQKIISDIFDDMHTIIHEINLTAFKIHNITFIGIVV